MTQVHTLVRSYVLLLDREVDKENLPYSSTVKIQEENFQYLVTVQGRRPKCLKCGIIGHIKPECLQKFCRHCDCWTDHLTRECNLKGSFANKTRQASSKAGPDVEMELNPEDVRPGMAGRAPSVSSQSASSAPAALSAPSDTLSALSAPSESVVVGNADQAVDLTLRSAQLSQHTPPPASLSSTVAPVVRDPILFPKSDPLVFTGLKGITRIAMSKLAIKPISTGPPPADSVTAFPTLEDASKVPARKGGKPVKEKVGPKPVPVQDDPLSSSSFSDSDPEVIPDTPAPVSMEETSEVSANVSEKRSFSDDDLITPGQQSTQFVAPKRRSRKSASRSRSPSRSRSRSGVLPRQSPGPGRSGGGGSLFSIGCGRGCWDVDRQSV